MPFWCDIEYDPASTELWIDFNQLWQTTKYITKTDKEPIVKCMPKLDRTLVDSCTNIVMYDWYHGYDSLADDKINWMQRLASKKPLTWITLNPKSIPGVQTIHFDYHWNRSKHAFLNKKLYHKVFGVENYVQYPINTGIRQKKFLNYHFRNGPIRCAIRDHLIQNYDGFYNDTDSSQWLLPNVLPAKNYTPDCVAPPARIYYDESYVTCLVESQYSGTNSHLVSEKTYDNLIQGRPVFNFATPGFYQYLASSGWAMPADMDWTWDEIVDDQKRLVAYLKSIDKLLNQKLSDLHDWFMSNMVCWSHNQEMLKTKPFDVINLDCIKQ
jgi:hypothetical protein